MVQDKYGVDVTEQRWAEAGAAIQSFIRRYPLHWSQFRKEIESDRTEYQLAREGDLRKASWRNTLSFPVIARPRTPEEIALDPAGVAAEFVESIKVTLDDILPGFTAPDDGSDKNAKDPKPNKLYREFIRRFGHLFQPGEKS